MTHNVNIGPDNIADHVALIVRTRERLATGDARRIREAAGLTRSDLGSRCDVDPQTIRRWEAGINLPPTRRLLAYGRLLDELAAILGDDR